MYVILVLAQCSNRKKNKKNKNGIINTQIDLNYARFEFRCKLLRESVLLSRFIEEYYHGNM